MCYTMLNVDGYSLGNPGQQAIGGMLMDHYVTLLTTFSKHAGMGLAIEVEILTFLEGIEMGQVECLSNLLVERDLD